MSRPLIGSCVQSGFLPVGYVMGCGYHDVMAAHQKMCDAICRLEEEILLTMDGKAVDTAKMQALRDDFEQCYEAYLKAFHEADGDVWENAVTPDSVQHQNSRHARLSHDANRFAKPSQFTQKNIAEHQS